jgi:pyruvate dehydrogenase E2 component (dihydrolipoamide acetyltransferase)
MDIKLPNLGEGADSGTVVNIFVKEGDSVAKDQPLLELENEKAVATIPASASGVVTKVYVKTGDKISVGARLVALGEGAQGEAAPAAAEKPAKAPAAQVAYEREVEPIQTPSPAQVPQPVESFQQPQPGHPVAAAPSIRKLARDLGIDLTRVRGTARGGRIILEDVRAYIQYLQRLAATPKASAPGEVTKAPAERIDFSKWGPVNNKPLSALRQVIARRMSENWNAVPHVTQFADADITGLNALRKQYAGSYESKGARLTLTSFAIKAVVNTLKKHPVFNCSLDEVAQELVFKEYYHIGIAVDTEAGLIVPVIRDADKKNMLELSQELESLAQKARDRKLSAEELKGGTFTLSNQGGIGGAHFTPIVNKPEVAILGLGRGAMQPAVRGNGIEPRLMMPMGLSYDHRVIDGGTAARFAVDLVQAFENFREEDVKI